MFNKFKGIVYPGLMNTLMINLKRKSAPQTDEYTDDKVERKCVPTIDEYTDNKVCTSD